MKNLTRSSLWLCLVLGCSSGAMSPGSDDASSDTRESGSGGSSSGGALGSGGATASGGAVTLKADGLHPNTAGYVVLGQSFYGVIGALLPAGP